MTNIRSYWWQANSIPQLKNFEIITCGECNTNQIAVHKKEKDRIVNFTCTTCYSKV